MPPAPSRPPVTLKPADFFVLRTPLLPVGAFLDWGSGLRAPEALAQGPGALADALAEDRRLLRARLARCLEDPGLREALLVASPGIDANFDTWRSAPDSEHGRKLERTLVRYFSRMSTRPTPFGLFAGMSVGRTAERTRLDVRERAACQRHTRLDMDYLDAVQRHLATRPELRESLRYTPNSSLYPHAGRLRYAECHRGPHGARTYELSEVEPSEYILAPLERARAGATPGELADALIALDATIVREEALGFISELVDLQLLVPDLELRLTGPEPLTPFIDTLARAPASAPLAQRLRGVRDALQALDAGGMGHTPEPYQRILSALEPLGVEPEPGRLFQVDLYKPMAAAELGPRVLTELTRGVELLSRLSLIPLRDPLQRFREAFTRRYEGREVPLAEALDEENGVGFPNDLENTQDLSPLLDGFSLSNIAKESRVPWGPDAVHLLERLTELQRTGGHTLELGAADLEKLGRPTPHRLVDSFSVRCMVLADSAEAVDAGNFRLVFHNATGPSGANLLGRFCHGDTALREHVRAHLRDEEAQRPDAVFAEVVHLPQGRLGNILARPTLRDHAICYLGHADVPPERQLPLTDLLVSVVNGRVRLRSRALNREVLPRLSSAHNYRHGNVPLYHFLCSLGKQDSGSDLFWVWGPFEPLAFLPRVTHGRLVLSLAMWRLSQEQLKPLERKDEAAAFTYVQELRAKLRLPRYVLLRDGDNQLPIDLDNVLSVDTFVQAVRHRDQARLSEMPGHDGTSPVGGAEGRFTHELIVPFIAERSKEAPGPGPLPPLVESPEPTPAVPTHLPPGSDWLFLKVYCGPRTAEAVLRDVVAAHLPAWRESGLVRQWFFIRYGDPDWHLRLRFHGEPSRLCAELLPALYAALAPLLADGRVAKVQVDTYEREMRRYGGPAGMLLGERLFQADSDAVLRLVDDLRGEAGEEQRWRLALLSLDRLLEDFGYGLEAKHRLMDGLATGFAREYQVDATQHHALSARYRRELPSFRALVAGGSAPLPEEFRAADAVLRTRSEAVAPLALEYRGLVERGASPVPLDELVASLLHMAVNRLLRTNPRTHEVVLYDFLARAYASAMAREKGARKAPSPG